MLSIGAVAFDNTKLGEEFYIVVNSESCIAAGLKVEQGTLNWWEGQSEAARTVLAMARHDDTSDSLHNSLVLFNQYLQKFGPDVRVWGNGADFDNAILYAAYAAVGLRPYWKFYSSRCHRTLKALFPSVLIKRDGGTHHNALDDAKAQAAQAIQCLHMLHNPMLPL